MKSTLLSYMFALVLFDANKKLQLKETRGGK